MSNYNNFGATIGGPIAKNKVFYFFGYDKTTQRVAGVRTSDEVPTLDQRAGDFSAYLDPTTGANRIYDPFTGNPDGTGRTPFANNMIPLSRQSAIARNVQTYYPEPNAPGTLNNYFSAGAPPFSVSRLTQGQLEREQQVAALGQVRQHARARFGQCDLRRRRRSGFRAAAGNGKRRVNLFTIGNNYTISPTMLYDGVVGFWPGPVGDSEGYGTNIDLGIPGVGGPDIRQQGFPNINPGYTGFGAPGWQPMFRIEQNWTTSQNFTWIKNAHQIRFGFDMIYLSLDHWQPGSAAVRAAVVIASTATSPPDSPNAAAPSVFNQYAAFLLGQSSDMQKALQHIQTTGKEKQFAFYFTDRYQATNKLTFNFGLRYEYFPLMQRFDGVGLEVFDRRPAMTVGGRRRAAQQRPLGEHQAVLAAPGHRLSPGRQDGHPHRLRSELRPDALVAPAARSVSVRGHLRLPARPILPVVPHARGRHSACSGSA
ncbi:MAG: hypothetical protein R2748_07860 [Bryobacterales bacterium]